MTLPAASAFIGASITEAQFKTAIADLRDYIANLETVTPGTVAYFPRTTAPSGWLKLNGAVITVAAYSTLVTSTYCGDAANATAAAYYRCTDPDNPSTTRSTTGAYFVLGDLRGEFVRALDDGRGLDAARVVASAQSDEFKTHTHSAAMGLSNGSAKTTITGSAGTLYQNSTSGAAGGAETRPRNVALLACIKY